MAGYCDEKMILPEFDIATCGRSVSDSSYWVRGTHLNASDDVVDVEGVEQRPELEIRLYKATLKVELPREDGLEGEVAFGLRRRADLEAGRDARPRRWMVEHFADLTARRQCDRS